MVITELIGAIVTAFTTFLTGIGASIVDFFAVIFVDGEGKLTVAAVVSLAFIGISFAMWIIRKLTSKVGL